MFNRRNRRYSPACTALKQREAVSRGVHPPESGQVNKRRGGNELLTPVSGCETGTSVLGGESVFVWRLCGEKTAFVLRASVILVMKTFQLARHFFDGVAVKQIIPLLYYTFVAQTG